MTQRQHKRRIVRMQRAYRLDPLAELVGATQYILTRRRRVIRPSGVRQWQRFVDGVDRRRVAAETVGDALVSTVFLGLNHQWRPNQPPLLFETMIFGGARDGHQGRYSTYDEAAAGHAAIVQLLQREQALPAAGQGSDA